MHRRLPVLIRSAMYALRGGFLVRPLIIAILLGIAVLRARRTSWIGWARRVEPEPVSPGVISDTVDIAAGIRAKQTKVLRRRAARPREQ